MLQKMNMEIVFDADWKDEVDDCVSGYSSLSGCGCHFRYGN